MKIAKYILLFVALFISTNFYAQNTNNAKQVLDKATAIINRRGGVTANFAMSRTGMPGRSSGTVYIKGNKFMATTSQMTVWFNGKTQWSYMKSTNEVNISNPTESQKASLNPLSLVNMYKNGYKLALNKQGSDKVVHLTATAKHTISEAYITVSASNVLKTIKMKQGGKWTTITVSNIKSSNLSDNLFTFNKAKNPKAEVVDLR